MDVSKAKQKLIEDFKILQALRETARASRAPVELDQQSVGRLSRMDALQKQNMELATEHRRQMRVKAIEAAIKRIDNGDFGYCLICDEKIAPQRIEFDPAISCCISCSQ